MSSSPRAAENKGLEIAPTTDRPSSELYAGQQAIAATKLSDHTSGQRDETRTPKGEEAVKLSMQEASGTSPQGSTGRPPTASQSLSGEKRWDDALARTKLNAAAQAASSGEDNSPRARWHRAYTFAKQISGPKLEQARSNNQDPIGVEKGKNDNQTAIARATSFDLKGVVQRAKEKAYNRDPETGKRRPFKGANGQKAIKVKKKLEEQHWLEMIDPKHRYGSNLKYYFEEWKLSEAQGNFFYWLDNGPGKNLSLAKCSREKLEKEKILYLSADQRRHYQIYIDKEDGKFRWMCPSKEAVTYCGEEHPLVDTTGQMWTDLGNGEGVAPAAALPPQKLAAEAQASTLEQEQDEEDTSTTEDDDVDDSAGYSSDVSLSSVDIPPEARPGVLRRTSSASVPSSSSSSPKPSPALENAEANKEDEQGLTFDETKKQRKKKQKKKKQKGDVWIYVSDSEYNLYLGIKQKGYFQHSSFLAGGPITSAGTLVIQNGVLIACNPMSGHYRTKALYFKRFIEELENEGADLSQVKVGQTELKLWFVERANTLHSLKGKTRRLAKGMEKKLHIDERHHRPIDKIAEKSQDGSTQQ